MNPNTAQGYEATGLNTPRQYPKTASDFLQSAASTLGERGKQYDPAGKQERSMTAIVAAFNAIHPHNPLTVHMGWQFMSLVKMVRGAAKPHADSALDQVAYAALAAEEVAEQLHQPAALCEDGGCPHYGTPHVCVTSVETPAQAKPYVDPMIGGQTDYERWQGAEAALRSMRTSKNTFKSSADLAAKKVEELLAHNRNLEVQLDTLCASFAEYACRFDLTKEYMTKEQVLAGQAKHEAQVEKLRERECLDIETINDLRTELASCKAMTAKFQAERKANVAMHEEVTRLRGKVQELAELAEYRDKRNAEICAELETQRGKCIAQSSRTSELQTLVDNLRSSLAQATKECEATCIELAGSTTAMRSAQEQVTRLKAEATEARKRGSAGYNKQVAIQAEIQKELDKVRGQLLGVFDILWKFPNPLTIEQLWHKVHDHANTCGVCWQAPSYFSVKAVAAPCEPAIAHNTDEPKATPSTQYVDQFDQYGDIRSPMHRLVGSLDPARGGLAYPNGKDAPTPL